MEGTERERNKAEGSRTTVGFLLSLGEVGRYRSKCNTAER